MKPKMKMMWKALPIFVAAFAISAAAQDAKTVIANATKAMGMEGLNSIHYYGVAQNGNLGQNNNASQPWPMQGANDYVRAIDFNQPASRATWMNYAVPVQGGVASLQPAQQLITPQNMAWAQQLEIWITPWGFLKGAAANNATLRKSAGRKTPVLVFDSPIKSPGGKPYQVVGYLDARNLVSRVETMLENPVLGDMLVEVDYTQYREGAGGLMYPSQVVQKRAGWPTFTAYILGAHANPPDLAKLMTPPAGRGGAPGPGAPPPPPPAVAEKLADGVWRIKGAYNSLAVEFADHILLFEPGPQNESRGQAVIAEVKRVIPNKPIKYGIISHHHFDHTSGLSAAVAEGITLVTASENRDFLMKGLSAPRTLAPDAITKSGKKPVIEAITGDKRVFQDATRTFEVHRIKGLPHADGLLFGYLPKEKILVFADMFGLPPADKPIPDPPVVGTQVFVDNLDRLKIDSDQILSIHSLNPDRLTSLKEIKATLGK
jgi:glyoxylase-like metal-dependent hydrolase (beta-lactamase superfamily II)